MIHLRSLKGKAVFMKRITQPFFTCFPGMAGQKWPLRILLTIACLLLISGGGLMVILSSIVARKAKKYMVRPGEAPEAHTAIVPGAYVYPGGDLSAMLEDRVLTAIELYREGKVRKILMSGDHGRESYDEVNSMRLYAERQGVPPRDIFMDHAGFKTYETMYRADRVFQVKSALVVTQRFHLARAVFLARSRGIDATGVIADRRPYYRVKYNELREIPARAKDYLQVHVTKPCPTFLGPAIPIEGDGRATHDHHEEGGNT